jgi:uncharacterized repeat protein (TIGR03803 family)
MFRVLDIATKIILGTIFTLALIGHFSAAQASSFKVLHSFTGGTDGCSPVGGLILDGAGNLYGTTSGGACGTCGTVFKMAPNGTETLLHDFTCGDNGEGPGASLVFDKKENLYGTTVEGGSIGCGVIFTVTPTGGEKTVHNFTGPPDDGCGAEGTLIIDAKGNLYGTTNGGGKGRAGTVFELASDGVEIVLYSFCPKEPPHCDRGESPDAGAIEDAGGDLYGTTGSGGSQNCSSGCGIVFQLAPNGSEIVLYKFKGSPNDGSLPEGTLLLDQFGNFDGNLRRGGRTGCDADLGCGAVFKLAPDGTETVSHFFNGKGGDGGNPSGALIADGAGNLFGTTEFGGGNGCIINPLGCGTVFELTPNGTETVLHSFGKGNNGANPVAGLVVDSAGNFYGTASEGGADGFGTVFEISP